MNNDRILGMLDKIDSALKKGIVSADEVLKEDNPYAMRSGVFLGTIQGVLTDIEIMKSGITEDSNARG